MNEPIATTSKRIRTCGTRACLLLVLAICFEISSKLIFSAAEMQMVRDLMATGQPIPLLRGALSFGRVLSLFGIGMALAAIILWIISMKKKESGNVLISIVLFATYTLLLLVMV